MKASVVKRGSAAGGKVLGVLQLLRRDVWAVVDKGRAGVVVESKVQVGMRDVGVLGIGIWGEGVREGAAFRKGAIIHRGFVDR